MEKLGIDIAVLIECFGPTPYLYMIAVILFALGEKFSVKRPLIRVYQAGIAVAVFIYLTVPRLFFSVPYTVLECVGLIAHSAAIAGIVFGLAGFVLHGQTLTFDVKNKFSAWRKARKAARENKKRLQREEAARARNRSEDARRHAKRDEEDQQRREEEEIETRKIEEERRKKETKKLRAELAIKQVIDKRHRESMEELLDRYLDQDLPEDVYEDRLEAFDEFASKLIEPPDQSKFKKLSDVEDHFANQVAEIEQMNIERYEKESLITALEMAKNAAVREFMTG